MKEKKAIKAISVTSIISVIINIFFMVMIPPVKAAQTVILKKGPFEVSIAVADIRQFAETGKVPDSLKNYTKSFSPEQQAALFAALKTHVNLSVVSLSNLLNAQIGNTILSDLATVTLRRDGAEVIALRGALVIAASRPQGLSVVNFLEAYPSARIKIDLQRAFEVMGSLNSAFWQTQRFMAAISPQLAAIPSDLKLPFDPTQTGSESVQVLKLTLNDQSRSRQIPVDIYWSEGARAEKPVIVFSHGRGSVRTELRYLAEHLASHGYIVAAPEHPGSNETYLDQKLTLEPQEFLKRPQDISFLLDELAKLNQSHPDLKGKINSNHTLILGYSFGGATALMLGGAELQLQHLKQRCQNQVYNFSFGELTQCVAQGLPEDTYQLRDARIKGVIALNPTTSLLFGDTGLSQLQVPTLLFATSADKVTPAFTEQIVGFTKMPSPKWLVGVIGGTHLSAKDPSTTQNQAGRPNTPLTGNEIVGDQAVDVRNYVKALTLAMAAQFTPDAKEYAVFLTPGYYQKISTAAFPVRLVTEIPPQAQAVVDAFIQENSYP